MLPGGHPLSAAMLPRNMIIVIICTLLWSYPPDSSPLRNSPVILSVCSCCLRSLSPHPSAFLPLAQSRPLALVLSYVMLLSQFSLPFASRGSLSPAVSRVILRDFILPHSPHPVGSAAAAAVAVVGEFRGNEEQDRSNRLSTKTTGGTLTTFPFRLSSCTVIFFIVVFCHSLSCSLSLAPSLAV